MFVVCAATQLSSVSDSCSPPLSGRMSSSGTRRWVKPRSSAVCAKSRIAAMSFWSSRTGSEMPMRTGRLLKRRHATATRGKAARPEGQDRLEVCRRGGPSGSRATSVQALRHAPSRRACPCGVRRHLPGGSSRPAPARRSPRARPAVRHPEVPSPFELISPSAMGVPSWERKHAEHHFNPRLDQPLTRPRSSQTTHRLANRSTDLERTCYPTPAAEPRMIAAPDADDAMRRRPMTTAQSELLTTTDWLAEHLDGVGTRLRAHRRRRGGRLPARPHPGRRRAASPLPQGPRGVPARHDRAGVRGAHGPPRHLQRHARRHLRRQRLAALRARVVGVRALRPPRRARRRRRPQCLAARGPTAHLGARAPRARHLRRRASTTARTALSTS